MSSTGTRHATGPAPGTVSATSAQRFAAKVRERRRRRFAVVVVVLALVLGGGWLVVLSPWATVKTIEIERVGGSKLTGLPASAQISDAELRAQAQEELGHSLLLARVDDVRDRLERLRLVRGATVRRKVPSTLVLRVELREPVAAVPAADAAVPAADAGEVADGGSSASSKGLVLVDIDGVRLGRVAAAPAGLPQLDVDLDSAGSASLRACLAMLRELPEAISRRVATIGADSPDGIRLRLKAGASVMWGSAGQTARKAEVLRALLKQKAVAYDVSSPDTPAVRQR
ncbi:cell division protein FtsQ/DivIB [Spongisporangium articulatum]|uniref:Cell division protein FtsQ/DivIB n=1 Tax=Spongisporangium articulatum TaxID=3362603 RepID=A0ABW8AUV0_9ACTN